MGKASRALFCARVAREFGLFWRRPGMLFVAVLFLASCAPKVIVPPKAALLSLSPSAVRAALNAFRISCPTLLKRNDASNLTENEDWKVPCAAAASWDWSPISFFQKHFRPVEIGKSEAFVTGYFEPEIEGSRTKIPGYDIPVYAKPVDLLETDPGTGQKKRGRINDYGKFVPYYERAEIEDGALAGRGLEIAWARDPIDFFFLQIQGSGRLKLPDGGVMRIGYAGQNGRDYVAIGRLMKDRGLIGPGPIGMSDIVAWLKAHPEEGRAIMRENRSYIFFRELTGPGPLGALELPVTPRVTVAADPKFVPLGAPVLLSIDNLVGSGLWVAQDTGGAIKGANRFDTFWGAGEEAKRIAGNMQSSGKAYILLPKAAVKRLRRL